nr:uncharacterized protein LOC111987509 [Quercus suber]
MSAIAWNCRGLGNPRTVSTLQKAVLEEDSTLVFLMETKLKTEEMAEIKHQLERKQGLIVPSVRRSGGLALLWKDSMLVDVQTYSQNHIDVIVMEENGNKKWRFTGFYGHPETSKREESWRLLVNLSTMSDLPWVCMGDFNEIRHRGGKEGGGERPEWQMKAFSSAISKSKLRDMGCVGPEFTWSKRLGARGWVRERLDRALVSTNRASLFPRVSLYNVANFSSDHNMLILKTSPPRSRNKRRQRLFRFEAMWIKERECDGVVKEAWERGRNLGDQNQFERCMEECRTSLQSWNSTTFGHVGRKIIMHILIDLVVVQASTPHFHSPATLSHDTQFLPSDGALTIFVIYI